MFSASCTLVIRLSLMSRHVRGSFFSDYVRMIRRRKDVDWSSFLDASDLEYVRRQVDPAGWYPMSVFERLGDAILAHSGQATLSAVRMWGHYSVSAVVATQPDLIAARDPVESLMRLKVMRASLFDFPAFDVPMLMPEQAEVRITYHMGPSAEEAACYQTMGFCEGVLSLAGATHIEAHFQECAWNGATHTRIELNWREP
jgi:hypothetical protein